MRLPQREIEPAPNATKPSSSAGPFGQHHAILGLSYPVRTVSLRILLRSRTSRHVLCPRSSQCCSPMCGRLIVRRDLYLVEEGIRSHPPPTRRVRGVTLARLPDCRPLRLPCRNSARSVEACRRRRVFTSFPGDPDCGSRPLCASARAVGRHPILGVHPLLSI